MIPVRFQEANVVLARTQDEYEPIAVHVHPGPELRMTCCFRLADAEVAEIVLTRTLWVQVLTFGHPFQPIALSTQRPPELGPVPPAAAPPIDEKQARIMRLEAALEPFRHMRVIVGEDKASELDLRNLINGVSCTIAYVRSPKEADELNQIFERARLALGQKESA